MKFRKIVGGVNIRLDTDRFDRNVMEAQKKLNEQIAEDCKVRVPKQQGALKGSQRFPQGVYGGEISWDTPYAHYQYEGILYLTEDGRSFAERYERKFPTETFLAQHEPGTSSRWFEEAKEERLEKWIKLAKEAAGR